jgi:tetratricopeptide (TPR) repeat protein
MKQTPRISAYRFAATALLAAAATVLVPMPQGHVARAQGVAPPGANQPDGLAPKQPAPPGRDHGAPGASPRALPKARSDGARALDKLPQTAEEKRKRLSDLYAQLATADDEEAAGKFAASIEQLWRLSGSDTVNLLISRAAKVAGEKRNELAERLLDRAVTLAPDYTEGFSQRAFYFYSQNNLSAALGDLRRVLALDPNHFKALEGLVQIWRDTDNKKAAFEVLKRLLDVHPHAPGAQQAYDELKVEVEGRGI